MNPIFLTVAQVLRIHEKQLAQYGGLAGVREPGLVMAAAYLFHLTKNHPFVDANKRVGLVVALFFLEVNGYKVVDPGGILYDGAIAVAEGRMGKDELAGILRGLATAVG